MNKDMSIQNQQTKNTTWSHVVMVSPVDLPHPNNTVYEICYVLCCSKKLIYFTFNSFEICSDATCWLLHADGHLFGMFISFGRSLNHLKITADVDKFIYKLWNLQNLNDFLRKRSVSCELMCEETHAMAAIVWLEADTLNFLFTFVMLLLPQVKSIKFEGSTGHTANGSRPSPKLSRRTRKNSLQNLNM